MSPTRVHAQRHARPRALGALAALLLSAAPAAAPGAVKCYPCAPGEMVVTETNSFGNVLLVVPGVRSSTNQCELRGPPLFGSTASDLFAGRSEDFVAERPVDPNQTPPKPAANPGGIGSTSGLLTMVSGTCPARYIPADHTDCSTLRDKLFPNVIGKKDTSATGCAFKGGAVMCAMGGPDWSESMISTADPIEHVFVRVNEEYTYANGVHLVPSMRGRIISDLVIPVNSATRGKTNRRGYTVRFDTLGDATQTLLPEQLELVTGGTGGGPSDLATYLATVAASYVDKKLLDQLLDGHPMPFVESRMPTCNNNVEEACSKMCRNVVRLSNSRPLLYPGMVGVRPHGSGNRAQDGSKSVPKIALITAVVAAVLGLVIFLGGSYTALFVVGRRKAEVLAQERQSSFVGVVAPPPARYSSHDV